MLLISKLRARFLACFPASIISVGSLAGSVVAGSVMDKLGRRITLVAMAPVLLLGWLTMALAPNFAGVLTGRAICGVATAFLFSTGPVSGLRGAAEEEERAGV